MGFKVGVYLDYLVDTVELTLQGSVGNAISAMLLDSQPSLGRGRASHLNYMINRTAPGEPLGIINQSIHAPEKTTSISTHFNRFGWFAYLPSQAPRSFPELWS